MFKRNTEPATLKELHSSGNETFVLVTDGLDFATTSAMEDETIAAVEAAEKVTGKRVQHVTLAGCPKLCQKLYVAAVPCMVKVVDDEVVATMYGISNSHQYVAFMQTGITPV